ncbi:MAG: hypothetical protein COB04_16960 [Gammaproteobacteria bacterium]|nr:MAG: hypothetical protein COB04_16960 [Gammaproteobacteria bacterium]
MSACLLLIQLLLTQPLITQAQAHGIRDRIRINGLNNDTAITSNQADTLTLTLVEAAHTQIQTWVRTAATMEDNGRTLRTLLCSPDIDLIKLRQRVRAFPADSKSSVYQARITHISPPKTAHSINPMIDSPSNPLNSPPSCRTIEATLAVKAYQVHPFYILEIIVPRQRRLAIPSEAIIDEGDKKIVYVSKPDTDTENKATANKDTTSNENTAALPLLRYTPREIDVGLQGELYTEIINGLNEGEKVVTFGSFFIDAHYKLKPSTLKSSAQANQNNAHHNH